MKVIKPFNSINRRFNVGDTVTPDDLRDEPLTFQDRVKRGEIGADVPRAAPSAAAKSEAKANTAV